MTHSATPSFDGVTGLFADYGRTLRGYVRYQLTQRNLQPYIKKKPMRVIDIGGGSGPDAAWLSALGHHVTLVEPSAEQRTYAERRFNYFLSAADRARIHLFVGTIEDLPAKNKLYDMVLLHGVALYQAKPDELVSAACKLLKPGGLISVVEKGYPGAIARAIRESNFENLRLLQTTGRILNHIQQYVFCWQPAELEAVLEQAGCKIEQWTGIRVITDQLDMNVGDMRRPELAMILDAEAEQGTHENIRGQGQLLHFIARKL